MVLHEGNWEIPEIEPRRDVEGNSFRDKMFASMLEVVTSKRQNGGSYGPQDGH